jgi:arylsulfatase A-like enzyme
MRMSICKGIGFAVLTLSNLVLLCGHALADAAPAEAVKKPNVLFILADDYRADCLGALGNSHVRTPNLDKLADRGMVFANTYCLGSMVGAVCLPSRTMLLTGRPLFHLPARNSIPGKDYALWPKAMSSGGYETFHLGKKGNSFVPGMEAFDTCIYASTDQSERALSSQKTADGVIEYLQKRKGDKPFFVYLAPPVPHDPRVAPKQFMDQYDPAKIPLPLAFLPVHPFDNGEMTVRDEMLAPHPRTPEIIRRHLADYYACVTCLDYHIGRIIDVLRRRGELDNTLIIFTGDNGLSLGDHGLLGKQNVYEYGGMHVPMIIAGPGIPRGNTSALVYLYDIFPTVCELTGTPIPPQVESKSFAPIIAGKAMKVRDYIYTVYKDVQRGIRDERWKLIQYPQINKTQLFDLGSDPHELNNLADKPECTAKVKEMMALLAKAQKEYDDTCPLVSEHPSDPSWLPEKAKTAPAKQAKRGKK